MKKLLLFAFAATAFGQTYNLGVVYTNTAPTGACTARSTLVWDYVTGDLYGCDVPTWSMIAGGGGGGGGTVTSVGMTSDLGTVTGSPVTSSGTIALTVSAAQIVAKFMGCSGVDYLGADGSCHTPASGSVTSVGLSTNLGTVSGSPVTGSGTLTNTVTAANVVSLFSTCSGTQYLGADGACHTPSSGTGTVTSIATTSPISGGTITTTGTISCPTCAVTGTGGVWTVTGSDIYNSNAGNVGIGGAPGNFKLDVSKSGSDGTVRFFDQTATTGITKVLFQCGAGQCGDGSKILSSWTNTVGGFATININGDGSFGIYSNSDTFRKQFLYQNVFAQSSDSIHEWKSSTDVDSGSVDLGAGRNSAGVLEINNGTLGTYRDLKLRNETYTGYSDMTAIAAPSNPSAGLIRVYADSGTGNLTCLTSAGGNCLPGSGTVTTTGSPTSGNLTKFSGASSITNGDLSGDVTTSGTLTTTVGKVNGISYSATAAAHSVEVITTANTTATAKVIPDCTDTGGNHLNFTQSTDAFSCGTSGSGGTTTSQGTYASLPGTCTTGDLYLMTDSYYDMTRCSASNTWSYFLRGKQITLPGAASGYTVINGGSGSAAAADSKGGVTLSTTSDVVGIEAAVKAVPSAPYTKTLVLSVSAFRPGSGTSNVGCGVLWTNGTTTSSSVQWLRVLAENSSVSTYSTQVVRYTSFAFAGGAADANLIGTVITGEYLYMRLQDDNTNRKFLISGDGVNFVQIYSVSRTSPFTPTHYGFGCGVQNSGTGIAWAVTDIGEL